MKKWEYFTYSSDLPKNGHVPSPTEYFNDLGQKGWELVSTGVTIHGQTVAYFKKEIEEND